MLAHHMQHWSAMRLMAWDRRHWGWINMVSILLHNTMYINCIYICVRVMWYRQVRHCILLNAAPQKSCPERNKNSKNFWHLTSSDHCANDTLDTSPSYRHIGSSGGLLRNGAHRCTSSHVIPRELCFFVVWALILLLCLRLHHCLRNACAATVGAYADHAFEGVPTQGQRLCKTMPQRTCLPTPSHSWQLLEVWKRNFCLRNHSPIHSFAKYLSGMPCGTLQYLQQHKHPGSKAPIDILQPHPAAAPAPRSQSAH